MLISTRKYVDAVEVDGGSRVRLLPNIVGSGVIGDKQFYHFNVYMDIRAAYGRNHRSRKWLMECDNAFPVNNAQQSIISGRKSFNLENSK